MSLSSPTVLFAVCALAACLGPAAPGCRSSKRDAEPEVKAPDPTPRGAGPRVDGEERPWPRLRAVLVADLTPPERRPIDLALEADSFVRSALSAEGLFAPAASEDLGGCAAELEVVYALMVNGEVVMAATDGVGRAALDGRVHCPGPTAESAAQVETFRAAYDEELPFGGAHGRTSDEALREALERLAERVAGTLWGQVVVRHASDEEVLELLRASEREGVLMEAASEAGERKLEGAVEALIPHTRRDDVVALRSAASIGMLGQRTEEALRALAAMTAGSDPERHVVAIHALADLGGEQAARYLETLAVGHPAAAIRGAARQAAERARAKIAAERARAKTAAERARAKTAAERARAKTGPSPMPGASSPPTREEK